MDTQTQVERLIELAIVQRTELRQLVEQLPQLREHLNAEIERTFEEVEPQIRTELEEFCAARATDEHAKTGAALAAKIDELSKQLEATTSAKYSVLMAERAHNVELERIATEQVAQAAKEIPSQVKAIVADELSRFPRAGEIDQLRKEFATPAGLNPRGKWQSGQTYERLDVVSYNGNSYIANGKTSEKPSADSTAWTINAARGTGGGGPSSLNELTQTPTNGSVLIGSGTSWVTSTLTAGTGISIANAAGSITINATDGNITLDDGTAAAPALNFTNYPTTGLYSSAANAIGFATSGVARAAISSTGLAVTGTITPTGSVHAAAGSVGNPSLAFNADQDTGLFNIGANNLGVAIGGAKVLDVASTGLTVTGALGATSLTSPASTNLTLATTDSGAAITVLSASKNVGIGTTTPAQLLHVFSTGTVQPVIEGGATEGWPILEIKHGAGSRWLIENGRTAGMLGFFNATTGGQRAGFTDAGNLLLGTTTDMSGSGGLKVAGTTSATSSAGAIVATGGVSAKNLFITAAVATYDSTNPSIAFSSGGGALGFYSQSNTVYFTSTAQRVLGFTNTGLSFSINGDATTPNIATDAVGASGFFAPANGSIAYSGGGTERFRIAATTGAATFAGAVTISSSTPSTGAGTGALQVAGGIYAAAASVFGSTATFAGIVNANSTIRVTGVNGSDVASTFVLDYSSPASRLISYGANSGQQGTFTFLSLSSNASLNTTALSLSATAATFAGAVTIGNTVNSVSPTSPNRTITMVVGGVTLYIAAKTTND